MQILNVRGGNKLCGEVRVSGAKNSVLKLMAASVICPGEYTITCVPAISDVFVMSDVLRELGASVIHEEGCLHIDTRHADKYETPYELVKRMRASIAVLGPLLARFGKAKVSMPGGCQIGERKLDLHFSALEHLGVEFEIEHGVVHAHTPNGLHGGRVTLDFASVGATENFMMAAVLAKGTSIIDNAAREPEIVDLANFLNDMGARITGAGSPVITIEGVSASDLHAVSHETIGDRIEAGTLVVAGALCKGPVKVSGFKPEHLGLALQKISDMGAELEYHENGVTVKSDGHFKAIDVQTLPFPGFPTDMQAQLMVVASVAEGNSIITENVFENRFMFAAELVRMGAEIRIDGHHALIQGVRGLSGAPVASTDLRGGASLVLAGLIADGETQVSGLKHIKRGYENYSEKLRMLGADISLIDVDE